MKFSFTARLTAVATVSGALLALAAPAALAAPGDPVVFADPALETCVAETLGVQPGGVTEGALAGHAGEIICGGLGIRDLSGLEHATSLQRLSLWANDIDELTPLQGLTELRVLDLSDNQLTSVEALAGMPHLETLGLDDNLLTDVDPLGGLPGLREVALAGNNLGSLAALGGLSNLTYLALENNGLSDISELADLHALGELYLAHNAVTDLRPLAGLAALRFLELSENEISDVSPLAALTELEYLALGSNRISDVSALSSLTSLEWLELQDQVLLPETAVTGEPHTHVVVRDVAGAVVDASVTDGVGDVSGGAVTWQSDGSLGWETLVPFPGGSAEFTVSQRFTTTPPVRVPPTLSGNPPAGVTGQAYSYEFHLTGDPAATVSVTRGAMPPGLTISPDGKISGVPTAAGSYTFTLTATNGELPDAVLTDVTVVITDPGTSPPSGPNGGSGGGDGGGPVGGGAVGGGQIAQTGGDAGFGAVASTAAVATVLGAALVALMSWRRSRRTP